MKWGFVLAVCGLTIVPASAQERVALVVGNGAYTNAKALPNPKNDAADMAAVLRELGFVVVTGVDTNKVDFDQKVREFARAVRTAKVAAFFYAGHGMQVAGKNYAVPIDAKLESSADLPVETVDIDQVVSIMESDPSRVNLVFLDACRDNPLARSFARNVPATRAASVGSGLNAIEAGRGTMIAFSTAPNKVALDGQGRNSPFTTALLKHIRTPGLDIAFVMRRVTADVEKFSGGSQVPWVHASLISDVTLAAGDSKAAAATPPPVPPTVQIPPNDEVAWNFVKDSKTVDELNRFKVTFPNSKFRGDADRRIAALETEQRQSKPSPPAVESSEPPGQKRIPLASLSPEPKLIGTFGGWKSYVVLRDGGRECFSFVAPTSNAGSGQPLLMISNRPKEKTRNEVSFNEIPYPDKTSVEMLVRSTNFPLYIQRRAGWIRNKNDEENLVTLLRSGDIATLKGTGLNGRQLEMSFPLKGAPQAIERAMQECRD